MAYKIPYTFIPGTKAKANEVNSNFSKVADYFTELNTGLTSAKTNLESVGTDLEKTKKLLLEDRAKFCVNSSLGTLITTSGTTLYFNSSFVITNAKGITATITTIQPINCQALVNGTYNIFVGLDSSSENFANKIYKQKTEPTTKNVNDVWLNTSQEPIFAGKWDGTTWVEYLKVPVGNVVIENNTIKSTSIFTYNQNGYNINANSDGADGSLSNLTGTGKNAISLNSICDYSRGTTKAWNTVYCAELDGYIFSKGYLNNNKEFSIEIGPTAVLGNAIAYSRLTDTNNYLQLFVPIPKGYYYRISGSGSDAGTIFYPTKGAN